jgi:replicative DNA helicase
MDEIDATPPVAAWVGVPTGFTELDEVTNGLHPGQMIIGRHAQVGKARWTRRSTPAG